MKLTDYERGIIWETIDKLYEEDFLSVLMGQESLWDWKSGSSSSNPLFVREDVLSESGIIIKSGATKIVMLMEELDGWVLKTNFHHRRYDYCQREALNYLRAMEEEVDEYFAECYWFARAGSMDFYIQKRVETGCWVEQTVKEYFEEYADSELGYCAEDYETEEEYWDALSDAVENLEDTDRAAAVFCWDSRLSDFIIERDINDLHEGNYGRVDDRFYIIDYSGF